MSGRPPPPTRPCRTCSTGLASRPQATCDRCCLDRALRRSLDDGTGAVSPRLQPLYELLLHAPRPFSTQCWVYAPHVRTLLTELATGQRHLTHDDLHTFGHPRAAGHLRALLVTCGLLPDLDKLLLDFEAWLHRRLVALTGHPHERLLRQFGHWHLLPRMRAAAKPLPATAHLTACRRFNTATRFLNWLSDNNISPRTLSQPQLDSWLLTAGAADRQAVVTFWNWATANAHLPRRLQLTRTRFNTGPAMTEQRRLDLLRHYLHDEQTALPSRVAVCLLLLYAQPLSRILRLSLDDITQDADGQLMLQLGDPPVPIPEPFASLLQRLTQSPTWPSTTPRPNNRWLFPGRIPGQHLSRDSFVRQIRQLGFPAREARVSSLRQLVVAAPAPVIAAALGFHRTTTAQQTVNAGGSWNRYPADGHPQSGYEGRPPSNTDRPNT